MNDAGTIAIALEHVSREEPSKLSVFDLLVHEGQGGCSQGSDSTYPHTHTDLEVHIWGSYNTGRAHIHLVSEVGKRGNIISLCVHCRC